MVDEFDAQSETSKDIGVLESTLQKAGVAEDDIQKSVNDVEEAAKKKGWRPEGSRSAKEFLELEPLYEELKRRGKENKELKQSVDAIKRHIEIAERAGYQKAVEDLQRQRSDAIALSDEKSVNMIDQELKKYESIVPQEDNILNNPTVLDFQKRNSVWLRDYKNLDHADMNQFFIDRCNQLEQAGITDPEEGIRIVEKDLKKKFPNYFNNMEDSDVYSPVVSDSVPTGKVGRKKTYSFKDLNDTQKMCCRQLTKRGGGMTEEKYIEMLVLAGELQ